jgi:hypothetical protein
MRLLLGLVLLAGCVTNETRILAFKISERAAEQERSVKMLLNGSRPDDTESTQIASRAETLTRATAGLSKILGEPKR